MVLVCLAQHGEAVPEEVDPRRPLSDRGREEVERVARLLAAAGFRPRRILHSTKLRARQTAEILARHLRPESVEEVEGLGSAFGSRPWAERLRGVGEDVVVVGHLPHLARLAGLLLAGREDADLVRFRYGGVFCLERGEDGRWRLAWAVTPEVAAPC